MEPRSVEAFEVVLTAGEPDGAARLVRTPGEPALRNVPERAPRGVALGARFADGDVSP